MTSPLRSIARRGTVIVASLATAALALSVSPASAVVTGTISGNVLGGGNVEVVAYHLVPDDEVGPRWLYAEGVISDEFGDYEISGLSMETYRLRFNPSDLDFATEYYEDSASVGDALDIDLSELDPTADIGATLEAAGRISGTMTSASGDETTGNVTLFVLSGGDWDYRDQVDTDSFGDYEFGQLAAGTYRLMFQEDGTEFSEYWPDSDSIDTADSVVLAAGGTSEADESMDDAFVQDYLSNEVEPTITGTAQVGSTLTVYPGLWAPGDAGIMFNYQWYADDFLIQGATGTTYVPPADQAGMWLSVRVEASADGFEPEEAETTGVRVEAGPTVKVVSTPTISGTPQVGSTLTANPGTWDRSDATFTYQWETYSEGQQHSDYLADGQTYVPTAAIVGQPIWVTVVASAPGVGDGYAYSENVGPVAPPVVLPPVVTPPVVTPPLTDVDNTQKPKVQGAKKVGSTLKAKVASWIPAGASVKYQWLVNGKVIKKATKAKLKVTKKLKGKKVSVQVIATSAGSLPVTVVTKVGKIK